VQARRLAAFLALRLRKEKKKEERQNSNGIYGV